VPPVFREVHAQVRAYLAPLQGTQSTSARQVQSVSTLSNLKATPLRSGRVTQLKESFRKPDCSCC